MLRNPPPQVLEDLWEFICCNLGGGTTLFHNDFIVRRLTIMTQACVATNVKLLFNPTQMNSHMTGPGLLLSRYLNEIIEEENCTQTFFLKLFGHPRGIPTKIPGYPFKSFVSLGFEGDTGLFGPHPFTWKTPNPPEDIRTKKFGFWVPFSSLKLQYCL